MSNKSADGRQGFDKYLGHLTSREVSCNQYERSDSRPHEGYTFRSTIADLSILSQDNPSALPNLAEPLFVWGTLTKVVVMNLHLCPCLAERVCNRIFPQIPIEKEDEGF